MSLKLIKLSAKSIINNGGILENEFVNSDGEIEQRYWITIGNFEFRER